MDIEEEILAFGETEVWVECDLCRRAFGGPGLTKAIVAVGHANVCVDCLRKSMTKWGTPAEGGGAVEARVSEYFLCLCDGTNGGLIGYGLHTVADSHSNLWGTFWLPDCAVY